MCCLQGEPKLNDLLRDPILLLLLDRDGVSLAEFLRLIERARRARRAGEEDSPAVQ